MQPERKWRLATPADMGRIHADVRQELFGPGGLYDKLLRVGPFLPGPPKAATLRREVLVRFRSGHGTEILGVPWYDTGNERNVLGFKATVELEP